MKHELVVVVEVRETDFTVQNYAGEQYVIDISSLRGITVSPQQDLGISYKEKSEDSSGKYVLKDVIITLQDLNEKIEL